MGLQSPLFDIVEKAKPPFARKGKKADYLVSDTAGEETSQERLGNN